MNTKDSNTLVADFAASCQGACDSLIDFSIGSILRAIAQTNSSVVIWLQSLILNVLLKTRAATSSGSDLDSFVADFGFTPARLSGIAATGYATFTRLSNGSQALVPVGQKVSTADRSVDFVVILDTVNAAYDSTQNGYVIPAGQSNSAPILVQCVSIGKLGNIAAGSLAILTSACPYVDTVSNALAFTNGLEAESDSALLTRFKSWIRTLSQATKSAVIQAALSAMPGLSVTLFENINPDGTTHNGYFYVVVDDGTGNPPTSTITAVANAIQEVVGFTIIFGVFPPMSTGVSVSFTVASSDPTSRATSQAAVASYINGLGYGSTLVYSMLYSVIYGSDSSITYVSNLLVNNVTSDIQATASQKFNATVTVS